MAHQRVKTSLCYTIAAAVVMVVLYLVYFPAFSGPFLLDDTANIPQTRIPDLSLENLVAVAMGNTSGIFGRPIPALTFALNHHFTGESAEGFKLVNWLIHAVNTVLVFTLVFQLVSVALKRGRVKLSGISPGIFAFCAALLWAIHPLQVSTVMYVVQRMAQLSTLFTLLALIFYIRGRGLLSAQKSSGLFTIFAVVLFIILASFSKETGVLVPAYILLIELTIFRFQPSSEVSKRTHQLVLAVLAFVPLVLGFLFLAIYFDRFTASYALPGKEFTLVQRLMTESVIVFEYLKMIMIPNINIMSLYHDDWPVEKSFSFGLISSLVLHAVLVILMFVLVKRAPLISFGIGFFYISHALESTFLPLALMFEHRNYLALLGVVVATMGLLTVVLQEQPKRLQMAGAFGLIAVLLLGFQTFSRSTEWKDELTLNSVAVENNPESFSARAWFAVSLINAGHPMLGVEQFRVAQKIKPDSAYPALAIVQAHCLAGQFSPSDYAATEIALRTQTIDITTATTFGNLHQNIQAGFCSIPDLKQLQNLYAIAYTNPRNILPGFAKTVFGGNYASLLFSNGNQTEAINIMNELATSDRGNPELLLRLTDMQLQASDLDGASQTLTQIKNLKVGVLVGYASRIRQSEDWLTSLTEKYSDLDEDE